jgi:hypothetical protein
VQELFHTFSCFAGFSVGNVQVELMTVHAKWLSLMVAFGNKTIDLKEIVDEALENVRVGESISSQKNSI